MANDEMTPSELALYGESRQPALYGVLILCLVLNNVFVIARCCVNYKIHWKTKGRVFAEDVFCVLSGICIDIVIGNLLAATHYGLGLHTWRVNAEDPHKPQHLSNAFKHVWATMVLTGPTFTFIKLTLLFFYRRLFLFKQRALKIFWLVNLVYILGWSIGSTGFYIFQCWPPDWYYLQYYQKFKTPVPGGVVGQCNATSVLHVALPLIFGLVSDVALLGLPIAAIWGLKMATRRKVALAGVFSVGVIACALELGRILELLLDTDDKADASYGVAVFLILSAAEEVTAIACASLPIIGPPLWKLVRRRETASGSASYRRRSGTISSGRKKRAFYRLEKSGGTEVDTLAWPERPHIKSGGSGDSDEARIGEAIPMTAVGVPGSGGSKKEESVSRGEIMVRTDIQVQVEEKADSQHDHSQDNNTHGKKGERHRDEGSFISGFDPVFAI